MRKFEKVSRIEGEIELPKRSTAKSGGYDFIAIEDTMVAYAGVTYVKTGVKAYFPDDEILMLCNRSSNPKKKELVLMNRNSGLWTVILQIILIMKEKFVLLSKV